MDLRGKIIAVLPLQTGEGRNGIWRKQDYVLEYNTESQYPKRMSFNIWGEKIDQTYAYTRGCYGTPCYTEWC